MHLEQVRDDEKLKEIPQAPGKAPGFALDVCVRDWLNSQAHAHLFEQRGQALQLRIALVREHFVE